MNHSLSPYQGSTFTLITKHAKSIGVSPPFWDLLKSSVIEYVFDTDELGTFSGEKRREGTGLACAKRKCEIAIEKFGETLPFVLASEGSFGPHPFIPFFSSDHEILYMIDQVHDFHLSVSHLSPKTNYRTGILRSWEELEKFASVSQFPSHALILRPYERKTHPAPLFKGINSFALLKESFDRSQTHSVDGSVWVETDMRAHLNPSRMRVIEELSYKLAERLKSLCRECGTPGWGCVETLRGLECEGCGLATNLIKSEIFGCVKCSARAMIEPQGKSKADPGMCPYCNP